MPSKNWRRNVIRRFFNAHLEDNLLTAASSVIRDGAPVTDDEEMTPTVERLAVYLWLYLIDARFPAYVARVYAQPLQSHSLKYIQPIIAQNMHSLQEINTQEDITIQYMQSSRTRQRKTNNTQRYHPSNIPVDHTSKYAYYARQQGNNRKSMTYHPAVSYPKWRK